MEGSSCHIGLRTKEKLERISIQKNRNPLERDAKKIKGKF
jgi:hypothetical protein